MASPTAKDACSIQIVLPSVRIRQGRMWYDPFPPLKYMSWTHVFRRTLLLCRDRQTLRFANTLLVDISDFGRKGTEAKGSLSPGKVDKPNPIITGPAGNFCLSLRARITLRKKNRPYATSLLVGRTWANTEFAKPLGLRTHYLSTSLPPGGKEPRRDYAEEQSRLGRYTNPTPLLRSLRYDLPI